MATLDDALADPAILERMNLPGESPYGTSRASLLGSPTKIGILIDSSPGYFSPKMKLLQRELAGEYRTILFRDPAEQRDHFAQALGERCGEIKLWSLPFEVHTRLFSDGQFVASIQQSLFLFKREFPLIYARVKQLRGDLDEATKDYVALRFAENAPAGHRQEQDDPRRRSRPAWTPTPRITWRWPNWKRRRLENKPPGTGRATVSRHTRAVARARGDPALLPDAALGSQREPGEDPRGQEGNPACDRV